jgi:hypothetical protein
MMPPQKKVQQRSKKGNRAKLAKTKRLYRKQKQWESEGDIMEAISGDLRNDYGKSQSFKENKLLLYAIRSTLNCRIVGLKAKTMCPTNVSLRSIEVEVAQDFEAKQENIVGIF